MVKGFKDDKGTFHPVGQSKHVRSRRDTSQKIEGVKIRKARNLKLGDQITVEGKKGIIIAGEKTAHPTVEFENGNTSPIFIEGIERRARENFAELLRNNLESFNRNHTVQLEYGSQGGASKGLMFKGTNSFIVGKMTREQALDAVMVLDRYIDKAGGTRKKRGEELEPFVKRNISETIADLDLTIRGLREESTKKRQFGKPTGEINSQIRLLGGARNAIFSLLQQTPEPLHREIIEQAEKDRQEMLA